MHDDHPIISFENALVEAQLKSDVAQLDRLLDDELHFVGLGGVVFSKIDDLAAHRSGAIRITKMNVLDRHITALGPVVVVSVLMDAAATISGVPNLAKLRYMRVWCERADGWKVVAGQMGAAG